MIAFIAVQYIDYEGNWPGDVSGEADDPIQAYATHEEAAAAAKRFDGSGVSGEVWAVHV